MNRKAGVFGAWLIAFGLAGAGLSVAAAETVRDPTRPPAGAALPGPAAGLAEDGPALDMPEVRVRMIQLRDGDRRAWINSRWYRLGDRIEEGPEIRRIGRTSIDVSYQDTVTTHPVIGEGVRKQRREFPGASMPGTKSAPTAGERDQP